MTDKDLLYKVSGALRRLRLNAGYTAAAKFANAADINHVNYYRLESGKNMTLTTLNKILQFHNLTFKEFCEKEIK